LTLSGEDVVSEEDQDVPPVSSEEEFKPDDDSPESEFEPSGDDSGSDWDVDRRSKSRKRVWNYSFESVVCKSDCPLLPTSSHYGLTLIPLYISDTLMEKLHHFKIS
jgi:hypothetical protein